MARNDFNGDGRSDIPWVLRMDEEYHAAVTNWLATPDGGFVSNDAHAFRWLTAWEPYRYVATGDFDGDGRTDVLHRTNSLPFEPPHYYMAGMATAQGGWSDGGANFTIADPRWQVAGTGDFNGDGRDDILWRHDNGSIGNWLVAANGGFAYNAAAGITHVSADWKIASIGDFNGDGRDDTIWRHDNGQFGTWLANASGVLSYNEAGGIMSASTEWKIAGTGDFNDDGRDDILWRNSSTGEFGNWLADSNGSFAYNAAGGINSAPLEWKIADIGDYNGDGRDDILWRHDDGSIGNWLATASGGFAYNAAAGITPADTTWQVQVPDYMFP